MADKLTEFLISMARDEESLAEFLEDPRGTATRAGVPPGQAKILKTQDASRIFAQIEGAQLGGILVWICVAGTAEARSATQSRKPPTRRRAKRVAKRTTKR